MKKKWIKYISLKRLYINVKFQHQIIFISSFSPYRYDIMNGPYKIDDSTLGLIGDLLLSHLWNPRTHALQLPNACYHSPIGVTVSSKNSAQWICWCGWCCSCSAGKETTTTTMPYIFNCLELKWTDVPTGPAIAIGIGIGLNPGPGLFLRFATAVEAAAVGILRQFQIQIAVFLWLQMPFCHFLHSVCSTGLRCPFTSQQPYASFWHLFLVL